MASSPDGRRLPAKGGPLGAEKWNPGARVRALRISLGFRVCMATALPCAGRKAKADSRRARLQLCGHHHVLRGRVAERAEPTIPDIWAVGTLSTVDLTPLKALRRFKAQCQKLLGILYHMTDFGSYAGFCFYCEAAFFFGRNLRSSMSWVMPPFSDTWILMYTIYIYIIAFILQVS